MCISKVEILTRNATEEVGVYIANLVLFKRPVEICIDINVDRVFHVRKAAISTRKSASHSNCN